MSESLVHHGSCHCGNLRIRLRLSKPPEDHCIRSCACSFCRRHGTRTVSDPEGQAEIWGDFSNAVRYRFGSRTADYLLCGACGVYIAAVCETPDGSRAVVNTLCLDDRAAFVREAEHPDYDAETTDTRLARRARNWMPVVMRTE